MIQRALSLRSLLKSMAMIGLLALAEIVSGIPVHAASTAPIQHAPTDAITLPPHFPGRESNTELPGQVPPDPAGASAPLPTTKALAKRNQPPALKKIRTRQQPAGHFGNEIPAGWQLPIAMGSRASAMRHWPQLITASATSGVGSLCIDPCTPPLINPNSNSVLHHPHVFLIFWGPEWTDATQPDYAMYQAVINQESTLFNDLAGSGYNGILSQYYDGHGIIINDPSDPVLRGITNDTITPPAYIDQSIEANEIAYVLSQNQSWYNMPDSIFILLPQEGSTYADAALSAGGCAYHYVTNDAQNNLYALIPYFSDAPFGTPRNCMSAFGDGSLPAAMTVAASHEYAEAVTDPWDTGGSTSAWRDSGPQQANEIGDLCAPYHVQSSELGGVWVQLLFDNRDYQLDSSRGCDAGSVSFVGNPGLYFSYNAAEYEGMYGLATISPTDIWGVGFCYCGSYTTLAEHYDGSTWNYVSSPYIPSGSNGVLMGVTALSASNVWAAGNYLNTSTNYYQTLIEHYDGTGWSIVPSPNATKVAPNSVLYGIAAVSPTNIWAVGETYSSGYKVDQTLIEHYDGTTWTVSSGASLGKGLSWFRAVAAVPNTNLLWAVGGQTVSSGNTSTTKTLIEYYNGTSWSVSTSVNPSSTYNSLDGIAAITTSEVLAVGNYTGSTGKQQAMVEYYNGTSWFSPTITQNASINYWLTAVSADAANDIWAVGYKQDPSYSPADLPLMLQSDGTGYHFFPSQYMMGGNNELMSVTAVGIEDVWSAGRFDNNNGNVLIEQYT